VSGPCAERLSSRRSGFDRPSLRLSPAAAATGSAGSPRAAADGEPVDDEVVRAQQPRRARPAGPAEQDERRQQRQQRQQQELQEKLLQLRTQSQVLRQRQQQEREQAEREAARIASAAAEAKARAEAEAEAAAAAAARVDAEKESARAAAEERQARAAAQALHEAEARPEPEPEPEAQSNAIGGSALAQRAEDEALLQQLLRRAEPAEGDYLAAVPPLRRNYCNRNSGLTEISLRVSIPIPILILMTWSRYGSSGFSLCICVCLFVFASALTGGGAAMPGLLGRGSPRSVVIRPQQVVHRSDHSYQAGRRYAFCCRACVHDRHSLRAPQ
jgi:TolA-binding protein